MVATAPVGGSAGQGPYAVRIALAAIMEFCSKYWLMFLIIALTLGSTFAIRMPFTDHMSASSEKDPTEGYLRRIRRNVRIDGSTAVDGPMNTHNTSNVSNPEVSSLVQTSVTAPSMVQGCPGLLRPAGKAVGRGYLYSMRFEGLYTYIVDIGGELFLKAGYFVQSFAFRGEWPDDNRMFLCDVPDELRGFSWGNMLLQTRELNLVQEAC